MLNRESCPRCSGDVRVDRDKYGWYVECIICGYMRDLESVVVTRQNSTGRHAGKERKIGRTY
ncbi:hypothetical protein ACFLVN_02170 [Chloroflexota bacterium]